VSFVNSIFNFLRFNKRNWKAVVLCLITATVFWFFNALNKDYAANITLPLAFEYNQENFVPVKPLPESIKLNISGLGWELFRKSSGLKVPPLVIPLERPTEVKKIVGSGLTLLLAPQLEGLKINYVLNDTLFIDIDERIKRKLHLTVDSVENYLAPNVGLLGEIQITPDTIWVEGPKKLIAELPLVLSLSLGRKNIDKNFSDEVEIKLPHADRIKRHTPVVGVSFSVDELVEKRDTIPLTILNQPFRLKSIVTVKSVQCTYKVPAGAAASIQPDSVLAVIDLKNFKKGTYVIAPQLVGLPPAARLVKIDSVRVNF